MRRSGEDAMNETVALRKIYDVYCGTRVYDRFIEPYFGQYSMVIG
jgi:hypothetical protein